MTKLACIALGGAVGAVLRYALGGPAHAWLGAGFPWGTLAVNLLGSFAIGLATALFEASAPSPEVRLAVLTGGLGAFTTFSTFSLESLRLIQDRQLSLAAVNVVGSCLAGLALVYLGLAAGRAIVR